MNNFIDATAKSKTATKKQYWVLHTEDDLGSPKTRVRSDLETAKGFKQVSQGLYIHTIFEEGNRKVMYFCVGKYDRFEEARSVQFSYSAISSASQKKALPKSKKSKYDHRRFIMVNDLSNILEKDHPEFIDAVKKFDGRLITYHEFKKYQEGVTLARPGTGTRGGKDLELNAKIEAGKRFSSWLTAGGIAEVL